MLGLQGPCMSIDAACASALAALHAAGSSVAGGECAEALVRAGCDTSLRAKDGKTGREIAQQMGHTAVLERLDGSTRRAQGIEQARPESGVKRRRIRGAG